MAVVVYEKKGAIGYITINRPEVMNAMNKEVMLGLRDSLVEVRDDVGVRAVILTGAGEKAFSVGADLKAGGANPPPPGEVPNVSDLFFSFGVRTPIIAAVSGYFLGAGFFMALYCDIKIASEHAVFGMPEVALAMCPTMGVTQWLPRLIPAGIALKLLLTGERFSASDAYRFGFVSEVVPQDKLISAAESVAEQISNNGPLAVKAVKEAFWAGLGQGMDEGLRLERRLHEATRESQDHLEARKAFAEKRKPVFRCE